MQDESGSSLGDSSPETSDRERPAPFPNRPINYANIQRIDKYVIEKPVGKGGMGVVFKATHVSLHKTVALKLLAGNWNPDDAFARFKREAVALGKMNHPHVLTAFDFGESEYGPYLVMEFVDGKSMKEIVLKRGLLTLADAASVALETALGLQHVHERKLVHRDVKPSNLMLTSEGRIKILDLGLALIECPEDSSSEESADLTYSGQIMGTRDFMAPEQWLNTHTVDYRADIYGLACTIFFMLTGRAPYSAPGQTSLEIMNSHLKDPFPSLTSFRPDVPQAFDRLLRRMGEKDPNLRLVDAAEIIASLRPYAVGADLAAVYRGERLALFAGAGANLAGEGGKTVSSTVYATPKRQYARAGIAAALVFAMIGGIGAYLSGRGEKPQLHGLYSNEKSGGLSKTTEEPPPPTLIEQAGPSRLLAKHEKRVNGTAFGKGATLAASVSEDRSVKVFDLAKSNLLPWEAKHAEEVSDIGFVSETSFATVSADGKLRLWEWETDRLRERFALPETTAGGMTAIDISPDGRWAVTGGWDNCVRLWDLQARAEIASVKSTDAVYDVAVSDDARRVYFCGRDQTISVWQVDGKSPMRFLTGHTGWVMSLDISPDETTCVSVGYDDRIRLWDLASGTESFALEAVQPKAVKFFSRGNLFAVGDRLGKISIWNRTSRERLLTLTDSGPIDALAVTEAGDGILSGTDSNTVTFWPLRVR